MTTGLPFNFGLSLSSIDAKKASMSTWMILRLVSLMSGNTSIITFYHFTLVKTTNTQYLKFQGSKNDREGHFH